MVLPMIMVGWPLVEMASLSAASTCDCVAVDRDDVPVIALEAGGHVVAVGEAGHAPRWRRCCRRKPDEVVEPEVAGETGGLMRDAFLEIAVRDDGIDAMVGHGEVRGVERGGVKFLRDGEADRIARALAERSSGDFDALGFVALRMAGSEAAPLAEILELVERHLLEAGEMQERINQH